ncbi:hypothetical protein B0H14DRAFT_2659087 [Mycena olivaceomarginata]|nr:hypothetical protein B0H14DRAFT_2659087 [Mycena olivaceomarginata]
MSLRSYISEGIALKSVICQNRRLGLKILRTAYHTVYIKSLVRPLFSPSVLQPEDFRLLGHRTWAWVEGCDKLIAIKAKEATKHVDAVCARKHHKTGTSSNSEPGKKRTEFSQEAFVDALVDFIVGDD